MELIPATSLSQLAVLLDSNTASDTRGGQFDDQEYNTGDQHCDPGDNEDTEGSGGDTKCEALHDQVN